MKLCEKLQKVGEQMVNMLFNKVLGENERCLFFFWLQQRKFLARWILLVSVSLTHLDISYKGNHESFVLWLAFFTKYSLLTVHVCCIMWEDLFHFCGWILFQYLYLHFSLFINHGGYLDCFTSTFKVMDVQISLWKFESVLLNRNSERGLLGNTVILVLIIWKPS